MPELPEVETIRMQLEKQIVGRAIRDVVVLNPKSFQGDAMKMVGQKVTNVQRKGKMIIVDLSGTLKLLIHLKMSGQLVFGDSNLESKHTRVILKFDKGNLYFNDMRKFGWIKLASESETEMLSEKLGPEPFSKEFTQEYLYSVCQKWGRPVKLLLMDQEKVSGIGNIYANEALWCAEISPMKRARDLEIEKVQKLHKCILEVLEAGIKYGGSSAKDETFVDVYGEKGHAQEHFNVYQKQGEVCNRCGKTITKSMLGGRGTYFCPKCQE